MRPRARIHCRVRFVWISEESPADGEELWLADAGSGSRVGTVFDKVDWLLVPKIGDMARAEVGRGSRLTVQDPNPPTLKRPGPLLPVRLLLRPNGLILLVPEPLLQRFPHPLRQTPLMVHRLRAPAPLSYKTRRGGEDAFPPLPRLHGPGHEALSLAHALDVVEDGDGGVAGEDEVAVHAVDEVDGIAVGRGGRGDGQLRCREGLGDYRPAVDAAGTGRVPEGTGVGEDVLAEVREDLWVNLQQAFRAYRTNIPQRGELEDIFDG